MSGINEGGAYERLPDGSLRRAPEPEPAAAPRSPKKPVKETTDG